MAVGLEVFEYVNSDLEPWRYIAFGEVEVDAFLEALDVKFFRIGRPDRVRHSWGVKHPSKRWDHTLSSHLTPRPGAERITWIAHKFTQRPVV